MHPWCYKAAIKQIYVNGDLDERLVNYVEVIVDLLKENDYEKRSVEAERLFHSDIIDRGGYCYSHLNSYRSKWLNKIKNLEKILKIMKKYSDLNELDTVSPVSSIIKNKKNISKVFISYSFGPDESVHKKLLYYFSNINCTVFNNKEFSKQLKTIGASSDDLIRLKLDYRQAGLKEPKHLGVDPSLISHLFR
jgi:deoxyribodipyrimidine photolyase